MPHHLYHLYHLYHLCHTTCTFSTSDLIIPGAKRHQFLWRVLGKVFSLLKLLPPETDSTSLSRKPARLDNIFGQLASKDCRFFPHIHIWSKLEDIVFMPVSTRRTQLDQISRYGAGVIVKPVCVFDTKTRHNAKVYFWRWHIYNSAKVMLILTWNIFLHLTYLIYLLLKW